MKKTVVIVDDSAVIRQLVSMTLEKEGYEVVTAVDGKDALDKIEGIKIDMVISDLHMPQMDGIEFIKQLRAKNECKFTPIIMLTTESQEHKKQEGKKAGASGWIVKPFNARQLKDAIKKFIE
jgi:two-component system chemotaxis response regulator CheY